jgi:hypothetical protein
MAVSDIKINIRKQLAGFTSPHSITHSEEIPANGPVHTIIGADFANVQSGKITLTASNITTSTSGNTLTILFG